MDRKALYVLILTAPLILSMATFFIQIHLANGVRDERSESDCSEFVAFVKGLLEDVTTATDYCYDAKDNQGRGLDAIKIIENPEGGYLGIYHFKIGGIFQVRLGNSTDLLHWTYIRTVEQYASQPTIAQAPNGAYIVAFEKEDASSHLQFRYYSNLSTLIDGPPDATLDAQRTLSSLHEGTPNVYNVTIKGSTLNACIGFHYDSGSVDNAAVGWLTIPLDNPQNIVWNNTKPLTRYNQELRDNYEVRGNIGDRDYGRVFGRNFTLQEANLLPRAEESINRTRYWASWRIFLYDHSTNNFTMLNIKTHKGSTSFGNPTFTWLKSPSGKNAIAVTYFLFSEGAETGEAGQLIFYKEITAVPDDYPAIQEAINAANIGENIYIKEGTYSERVVVNKTVYIFGAGPEKTVIDCEGKIKGLSVIEDGVSLSSLSIKGSIEHGVSLSKVTNCTIFDVNSENNRGNGISIYYSQNCTIVRNIVSSNLVGIDLLSSTKNTLVLNKVTENTWGMLIAFSPTNAFRNNTMVSNTYHVDIVGEPTDLIQNMDASNTVDAKRIYYWVDKSNLTVPSDAGFVALINCTDIKVYNLTLVDNGVAILLALDRNVSIVNNQVMNNIYGIKLLHCSDMTIKLNNLTNNRYGISIYYSLRTTLMNNTLVANRYSFGVYGNLLEHFLQDINASNTIDGKPVLYLISESDLTINWSTFPTIGYLALVNCTRIVVENLTLSNNGQGILIAYTHASSIIQNKIENNWYGIYTYRSQGTMITGNNITKNLWSGVWLESSLNNTLLRNVVTGTGWFGVRLSYSSENIIAGNNIIRNTNDGLSLYRSSNNFIYHNSFIENFHQVVSMYSRNFWDNGYPDGGNYWSDYEGTDSHSGSYQNETGYDWIGDTPYMIDENDQDDYPLMYPFVPEMEEIRIAYRNLLLKYAELYSDFEALNSTLNKLLGNITDLQEKYNSLLTTTNDMQEHIDSLNSTFQMSIDDLQERVDLLNSTLQTSINELRELYNSLNSTLTSKQEAVMYEISTLRNIMYVFIATTIILIATTVYFAKRKPRTKQEKQ